MKIKFSVSLKYGSALFAIFLIALFLRIYFSYHNVFGSSWVNFQETDAWYNMRQVVNLALHFPHRILFDPYNFYPGGTPISSPPFYYLLLGFFAWVFGAGSPSLKVIETVGAYLPAILGALITVPVYFIGKELFNRKAGLLAAALIAILPGQFIWRSMLGFADYHVTETLFSATAMMFLILALKSSREKGISFRSLRQRDWGTLKKPLLYTVLAGIALGLYLLTWYGAGLFILIIFVFAVLQYIIDHIRGRSTDYIGIVGVMSFIVALVMMASAWNGYANWNLGFASLLISIVVFLMLGILSSAMSGRAMKRIYYVLALLVLGGVAVALFYAIDPSLFKSILQQTSVFKPAGGMMTIAEAQRLSLSKIWEMFTICFYLSLISLAIMAYYVIKEGSAGKTLLFIWSLIILVAAFSQNRFGYYFAVNVAVLTGYLSWRALEFAGLREAPEVIEMVEEARNKGSEKEREKTKRRKGKRRKEESRRQRGVSITAKHVYVSLALIVVFFLAFYPNIGLAIERVKYNTGVDSDWHESLVWMRDNTPDPFNNPDFFYKIQPSGKDFQYPDSAYGVMSWWDYGYYITYIAHRIPNANPGQLGAKDAGLFFTAQDEASGIQVLDRLGAKYIVIDSSMAMGKFYAMVTWAGKNQSQFFDMFYQSTQTGALQPVMLYFPEYYQSMCARLYNFEGKSIVPANSTWVISYQDRKDSQGNTYKMITSVANSGQPFATYDDAQAYLKLHPKDIIVGPNPFVSPVPLGKLEQCKLIHQSPTVVTTQQGGNGTISAVEIFEYSP